MFDTRVPTQIEEKLSSEPGLIISLFMHMTEQKRKRRSNTVKARVTFSNALEEIQFASSAVNSDSGVFINSDNSL